MTGMTDAARALEQRLEEAAGSPTVGAAGHSNGRPKSWALIGTVIVAFAAGGAAIILHLWPLLWACIGVAVLAVPVGLAMGVMDDTVTWEDPLSDTAGTGDAGPDPVDIVSPPPSPPLMLAAAPVSASSPPGAPGAPPGPPAPSRAPGSEASGHRASRAGASRAGGSRSEAPPSPEGEGASAGAAPRKRKGAALRFAAATGAAAVVGWLIGRKNRGR
jgi:hypothetical protein